MLSSLLIVFASLASFIVGTVVLFCVFFLYQQIKSKHRITRHQQLRNRNLDLSSVTVDGIASFDPSLLVEANVKEYFRIACLCTSEKSKERPLMLNVVELLDRIIDVKLHDDNEYQNKLDV
ncbi:hypothetical protein SDJN03_07425, partial [Cucurbita argyrosperma subsp. sororia]